MSSENNAPEKHADDEKSKEVEKGESSKEEKKEKKDKSEKKEKKEKKDKSEKKDKKDKKDKSEKKDKKDKKDKSEKKDKKDKKDKSEKKDKKEKKEKSDKKDKKSKESKSISKDGKSDAKKTFPINDWVYEAISHYLSEDNVWVSKKKIKEYIWMYAADYKRTYRQLGDSVSSALERLKKNDILKSKKESFTFTSQGQKLKRDKAPSRKAVREVEVQNQRMSAIEERIEPEKTYTTKSGRVSKQIVHHT